MLKPSLSIQLDDLFIKNTSKITPDEQRAVGFKPRADATPWPLRFPLDWGADPFLDANWRFMLNCWGMTDVLIQHFYLFKDTSLIEEAFEYARDWHRYHYDDALCHNYSWIDFGIGVRALRIAFFIDAAQSGLFDPGEGGMAVLFKLADDHLDHLMTKTGISDDNHGLFQIAGLDLLASVVPERQAAAGARAFAYSRFQELFQSQFTAEGVHKENSPDYHLFVRANMLQLAPLRRMLAHGSMEKVDAVAQWLAFPDGTVSRAGDSGMRYPMAFDPPPSSIVEFDNRAFAIGDFTKSGYAVIRSADSYREPSMLFVTGMAHNAAHKHSDELSFQLYEFGRFIFIDAGKYSYKRDHWRAYAMSAAAHNTISIAEEPIRPQDIDLCGSLLDPITASKRGFRISGAVSRPGHFYQARNIIYRPARELTVIDKISSDRPKSFVSTLLLAPDLVTEVDASGFSVNLGQRTMRARILATAGYRLAINRGEKDPLLGWSTKSYQVMEPATAVRAIFEASEEATIAWHVRFS